MGRVRPIAAKHEDVDPDRPGECVDGARSVGRDLDEHPGIDGSSRPTSSPDPLVVDRRKPGPGREADPKVREQAAPDRLPAPPGGVELTDVRDRWSPPLGQLASRRDRARMDQDRFAHLCAQREQICAAFNEGRSRPRTREAVARRIASPAVLGADQGGRSPRQAPPPNRRTIRSGLVRHRAKNQATVSHRPGRDTRCPTGWTTRALLGQHRLSQQLLSSGDVVVRRVDQIRWLAGRHQGPTAEVGDRSTTSSSTKDPGHRCWWTSMTTSLTGTPPRPQGRVET